MKKIFCLYILLMGFVTGYAQKASIPFQETISHKQAIEDLDTLIFSLKEIHPALFMNRSEKSFNKAIKALKKALPEKDITVLEYYKIIKPITSMFGEGHIQLYIPDKEFEKYKIPAFPLSVKITPGKHTIYTAKNYYVNDKLVIEKGTQILSINGKRDKSLITQLLKYSQGERDFFRCMYMESCFTEHFYMLYPDSVFHLKLKTEKGVENKTIHAVSYSERQKPEWTDMWPPYSFKQLDKNVMLMTFKMCTPYNNPRAFADSMFNIIKEKGISNLIIDIRKNPGGSSSVGDEFFQYISHVPFQQFGKGLCKYSTPMKKSFKKAGYDYDSIPNGVIEEPEEELIPLRENPLRFNGKVYLLTSYKTYSSAASFSWAFKYFNMGTTVGEETGGMNVSSGEVITQELPSSHIMYGIPCKLFYQYGADGSHIHGTLPDVKVPQEKALEKALQLIATSEK